MAPIVDLSALRRDDAAVPIQFDPISPVPKCEDLKFILRFRRAPTLQTAPKRQPVPPSEMIRIILEAMYDDYLQAKYANHEQRRDDLTTLESYARIFENPVDFLSQLSLMATGETEGVRATGNETEKITLSTIHQAKGLEWRAVFVIWLTDGMFPSSRSFQSTETLEEERRLFYVAATRAQDHLYLTSPYYWSNAAPENRLQRPSRFLKEIPIDLVEEWWIGS